MPLNTDMEAAEAIERLKAGKPLKKSEKRAQDDVDDDSRRYVTRDAKGAISGFDDDFWELDDDEPGDFYEAIDALQSMLRPWSLVEEDLADTLTAHAALKGKDSISDEWLRTLINRILDAQQRETMLYGTALAKAAESGLSKAQAKAMANMRRAGLRRRRPTVEKFLKRITQQPEDGLLA